MDRWIYNGWMNVLMDSMTYTLRDNSFEHISKTGGTGIRRFRL